MRRSGEKRTLRAFADEAGLSLASLLARRLELEAELAVALIERGAVYRDSRRARDPSLLVASGDKIVVYFEREQSARAVLDERENRLSDRSTLEIAYSDEDAIVVVKPSGLPSIAPRRGGGSLRDQIRARLGKKAVLLHRLDTGASGLLLVSLRSKTREHLASQVREHSLLRRYLLIVEPAPREAEQTVRLALVNDHGHARVEPGGKPAVTHLRVLAKARRRALLQAELETGRLHQIRAHCAAIGAPLVGDFRYGGVDGPRLALHAHCLGFRRPRSKCANSSVVELHSPFPAALRELLT
jgi:23S rRNA pseudouridine1911/1915/1917 synthase